jgi:hypothetical protein
VSRPEPPKRTLTIIVDEIISLIPERSLVGRFYTVTFFATLLDRYPSWRPFPVKPRSGKGWQGLALTVPTLPEADIAFPMDIELVGDEVTISLDYCHIHIKSFPEQAGGIWRDPFSMIDAILNERVVASSGWMNGRVSGGAFLQSDNLTRSSAPNADHFRIRSWKGTFNRDEKL